MAIMIALRQAVLLMVAGAWAGCAGANVVKVESFPRPIKPGQAVLIVHSEAIGPMKVYVRHERENHFVLSCVVPPRTPMMFVVPAGYFMFSQYGVDESPEKARTGSIALNEGCCYEWKVGR
jgi:hypothetical protein